MRFLPRPAAQPDRARPRPAGSPERRPPAAPWPAPPASDARSLPELSRAALRAGQGTWLIARAVSLRGF